MYKDFLPLREYYLPFPDSGFPTLRHLNELRRLLAHGSNRDFAKMAISLAVDAFEAAFEDRKMVFSAAMKKVQFVDCRGSISWHLTSIIVVENMNIGARYALGALPDRNKLLLLRENPDPLQKLEFVDEEGRRIKSILKRIDPGGNKLYTVFTLLTIGLTIIRWAAISLQEKDATFETSCTEDAKAPSAALQLVKVTSSKARFRAAKYSYG